MNWIRATIQPRSLAPLHHIWVKIGEGLGWINTRIVLVIVFYLVILPIALVMKIFRRDPIGRKLDTSLKSYRVNRKKPAIEKMEKPF